MSCQSLFLRLVFVYSDCRARAFGLPQFIGVRCPNELKTNSLVCSDAVAVALVCRCKYMCFSSYRCFLFSSDGIFTPRAPMPLHISPHLVRLIGRVPVNAAVRTFRIIEPNGLFDRFDYLLQAGKRLSVKEFVLDSIVDAFGHCIVFRVAALGHAWRNVVQSQLFYVLRAGVLGTAVGVVDEGVGKAFGQRGYGFLQSFYAVFSFKRRSHTTAQDPFAVGIHDKCQEAEAVAKSGRLVFYRHIGYVTDPYLVGTYSDHVLHKVRIGRQGMPRVGRAWGTKSLHNVQSALVKDTAEHVASHTVLFTETGLVHAPEFVGTDSRVLLPDLAHELDNKPLHRESAEQKVVIALVKGLSCDTGQRAELFHWIPLFSAQPFDCPVSAFFRISMPNISSATSIIVSQKSARIVSSYSFFFSSRISARRAFISSAWLSTGLFFISSALLSFSAANL